MTSNDHQQEHLMGHKTLLGVLAILILLTGITIWASSLDFGNILYNSLMAILIASIKSTFVLLYFMHLKFEKAVIKWAFVATIFFLAIMIGMTFVDIGIRYQ